MAYLRTFQAGKHGEQSQKLLNEVAAAKLCLLNSEKKAEYDAALKARLQAEAAPPVRTPAPRRAAPVEPGNRDSSAKRLDLCVDALDDYGSDHSIWAEKGGQAPWRRRFFHCQNNLRHGASPLFPPTLRNRVRRRPFCG